MAKPIFTPRAKSDLGEIWTTIAVENERAADALYHRLIHKAQLAAENPLMGSPRPELSSTARILVEGRYVLIYEPLAGTASIIAIVHGMRNPDSWLH